MVTEGRRRTIAALSRINNGNLTNSEIGSQILSVVLSDYAKAIEDWSKDARPARANALAQLPIETLGFLPSAAIAAKVILDSLGKATTANRLAFAIAKMIEVETTAQGLSKRALRFASKLQRTQESLVTAASRVGSEIKIVQYNDRIRASIGLLLIELFRCSTGLIDLQIVRKRRSTPRVVVPSQELLDWMDQAIQKKAYLRPRYGVMDNLPSDWSSQYDGGYNTLRLRGLIKGVDDYVFDPDALWVRAVNRLQRQPWCVLEHTLDEIVRIYGDNRGKEALGLNVLEHSKSEIRQKVLHQRYVNSLQHRYEEQRIIATAAEARRTAFYYPWFCDFRGRMYPIPSGFNPQGQSLARGLLAFPPEPVDDQVWWERGEKLLGCDSLAFTKAWDGSAYNLPPDAPDPIRALGYLHESRRYLREGASFRSGYPLFVDGKCNGLQMISLLMRDHALAEATNVVGVGKDIYLDVATKIVERLSADRDNPKALRLITLFKGHLPRALSKRVVMVIPYGATQHTIREVITAWYDEVLWAINVKFHKEDKDVISYLASIFWDIIRNVYPSCLVALDKFREIASTFDRELTWTSPSGFPVTQVYRKSKKVRVVTFVHGKTMIQKVRQQHGIDRKAMKEGLLPNFIHSLDAAIAHKIVSAWPEDRPIVSIHDGFGTTSNYLNDLRQIIKESVEWVFAQQPHIAPPISLNVLSDTPIPIGNFMYD